MDQFGLIYLNVAREYKFNMKIDNDVIQEKVNEIYKETTISAIEPTLEIDDENVKIISGKDGQGIDKKSLTNKIIDSIKRIPPSISRVRQLLPNMTYALPPAQDKINPIKGVSIKSFINTLREFDGPIFKGIYTKFLGISPSVAKEKCHRSNLNPNDKGEDKDRDELSILYRVFSDLFTKIKNNNFDPCIVIDENVDKVIDFSCINLTFLEGNKFIKNESISQIIEDYYKT